MSLFNFYDSKFWKKQPIDKKTKEILQKEELPENYFFKNIIDVNIDTIYEFLKMNYVNDFDGNFTLLYSKKLLTFILHESTGLALFHKNNLIGTIVATVKSVYYFKEKQDTIFINFLCVKKEFRNRNFAPKLISEIRRLCNIKGYFTAIFTGSIELPFSICSAQYYHYDLKIRKTIPSNQLIMHFSEHNDEITKKFMQKHTEYELYENYANFSTHNDIQYTFIYKRNGEILGVASFYILSIYNKTEDEATKNAYLYNSMVNSEIFEEFFYAIFDRAKKLGCSSFNCLDIGDNMRLIERLRFVPGTGRLNYYIFNFGPIRKISNEKISIIFA